MNIKSVQKNYLWKTLQKQTDFAYKVWHYHGQDYMHLLLLFAFTVFSAFPTPVLAFSNTTPAMQRGLQFQVPVGQIQTLLFVNGVARQPDDVTFTPGMLVSVWASAYSSTEAQTDSDPFTTAWGTHVRPGIIAANFLPLGTKVLINGQEYTVEDRLNSRYNNEYMIDVWMGSTTEALQFGIRLITFEIVSLP
jgi:3D (Asp-Asp-Asp) domain-containing protein